MRNSDYIEIPAAVVVLCGIGRMCLVPNIVLIYLPAFYKSSDHHLRGNSQMKAQSTDFIISNALWEQHRRRPACVDSDQHLVIQVLESTISKLATSKILQGRCSW